MVFVLKKKRLTSVILLCSIAVGIGLSLASGLQTEEVFLGAEGKTVIIDAGHDARH